MASLPITPTTSILATSTCSGRVNAKHLIRPTTNLAAISTVSGSIVRVKKILPASISATSTINFPGRVLSVKFIAGSINAISAISATLILKPGNILPANIMATSYLFEINLIIATVPSGYYGISDIEDGII